MASEAPIVWKFILAEREDYSRLPWNFSVGNSTADVVAWDYEPLLAEHDFLIDSFRTIGARFEWEPGDNAMRPLLATELPEQVTISGSHEGYGVRELSFGRFASGQSSLRSGVFAGTRRVRMVGTRGTLGGAREWPMFDGYTRETESGAYPPLTTITAQDALTQLNQKFVYSQAANIYKSRRSTLEDICSIYRLIPGAWDLGPEDGGYQVKPINEGGDRTVGAFLAEYLAPLARRHRQRNGRLDIVAFTAIGVAKRSLPLSVIRNVTVKDPQPDAPNAVRVSSDIYPYIGPDMTGSPPVTTSTFGTYAPVVATHKQDHTTGVISALSLTSTPATVETRREVMTPFYVGGSIYSYSLEIWGWYAPRAANRRQNVDGSTRHNDAFDVFKFPDNTWRTQQAETFQVIERWEISRTFNTLHALSSEGGFRAWMHDPYAPVAQLNGSLVEVPIADRFMTDDGRGWFNGKEEVSLLGARYQWWRSHYYDTQTLNVTTYYDEINYIPLFPYIVKPAPIAGAYVFGPTVAKKYAIIGSGIYGQIERWGTTFSAVTPTSHRKVTTALLSIPANVLAVSGALPSILSAADVVVNEPQPKIELDTGYQVPERVSIVVTDERAVAANGGVVIEAAPIENGWCETRAEMTAAGAEALRALRSPVVSIEMDATFDIVEADVVTLPAHKELGYEPVDLVVRAFTTTLSPGVSDGANATQLETWNIPSWLE